MKRFLCGIVALGVGLGAMTGCDPGEDPLLLSEWELREAGDASGRPVQLPAHLSGLTEDGETEYHLRTEVVLPERLRDRPLVLRIPYLQGPAALHVDGVPAPPIAEELVRGYRSRGFQGWHLPTEATAAGRPIYLEIVVAHRFSQAAWHPTVPRILEANARDPHTFAVRIVNEIGGFMGFVALFQLGLIYIAVFLVDRRRRAYLWFAVQGLTASLYPLWTLGLTQGVLGTWDVPIMAVALVLAISSSVYFTHAHFGLARPSRAWPALVVLIVVVTPFTADPFLATRVLAKITVAVVVVGVVYQWVVLARLCLRRPRPMGAAILLGCWTFLGGTAWNDLVAWGGLLEPLGGLRLACLGLAVFSLLQAQLLSRQHIFTLKESDDLNVSLAGRVQELETRQQEIIRLNDELRRQIAERSRQIFTALTLGGGGLRQAPVLSKGAIIQDRYRVVREVGVGGMGRVYEATRLSDGEVFALKIPTGLSGSELARLAREAQLAAAIDHPNVVAIVDVDVAEAGFLFVVMEYVKGTSLDAFSDRFGDLAFGSSVLAQVAEGLSALHDLEVVHRDLKPQNILVSEAEGQGTPRAKLADFGISQRAVSGSEPEPQEAPALASTRLSDAASTSPDAPTAPDTPTPPEPVSALDDLDEGDTLALPDGPAQPTPDSWRALTDGGWILGTPAFLAPELVGTSKRASPSADVFALGVVACKVLADHAPFDRAPALVRLSGGDPPTAHSLAAARPDLPPEVTAAIDRCLDPDPGTRPTARELATIFARAAPTRGGDQQATASASSSAS